MRSHALFLVLVFSHANSLVFILLYMYIYLTYILISSVDTMVDCKNFFFFFCSIICDRTLCLICRLIYTAALLV